MSICLARNSLSAVVSVFSGDAEVVLRDPGNSRGVQSVSDLYWGGQMLSESAVGSPVCCPSVRGTREGVPTSESVAGPKWIDQAYCCIYPNLVHS